MSLISLGRSVQSRGPDGIDLVTLGFKPDFGMTCKDPAEDLKLQTYSEGVAMSDM